MKNTFKTLLKLTFIFALFILSGCEKDLYEDKINDTSKDKMRYVTINDVPFLKPTLEKYNPNYRYLSNPNAVVSNKDASDLNLDLDHIIEYLTANGLKSYSIPIKNEFESDKDDYYFENLHVLYIDGDYKAFIAKYNQTDDSKKFETPTFTGKIELLDINQTPIDSVAFFNGQKLAEPAPPQPPADEEGHAGGSGDSTGDPNHGWLWNFIHWIFHGSDWNGIRDVPTSGDSSDSDSENSGGNGGIFIIIGGGGNPVMGDPNTPPTDNPTGGNNVVIIPNQPSWPEFVNNLHIRANLICKRLGIVDLGIRNWLESIANTALSSYIYDYLLENNLQSNYSEANAFILNVVNTMYNNQSTFHSIVPFMTEKQIDVTQLDPCSKSIINHLKGLQSSDIAKIFAKLNTNNILLPSYNTSIVIEDPINSPTAMAQTNWVAIPNPNGPQPSQAVPLRFNYIIRVRPSYLDGTMLSNTVPPSKPTKLSIARTLLHEIIHAYFDTMFDDCYMNNICTEIRQYPELWNAYVTYSNGGQYPTDAQHIIIAKNFTNILARGLQEYQTGNPVPDNVEPEQVYKDLAWQGLEGQIPANIFNQVYPPGSPDLNRFHEVNNAEDKNMSYNSGTLITPLSTPCN